MFASSGAGACCRMIRRTDEPLRWEIAARQSTRDTGSYYAVVLIDAAVGNAWTTWVVNMCLLFVTRDLYSRAVPAL